MPTSLNDPLLTETERNAVIWLRDRGLNISESATILMLARIAGTDPQFMGKAMARLRSHVRHTVLTVEPR